MGDELHAMVEEHSPNPNPPDPGDLRVLLVLLGSNQSYNSGAPYSQMNIDDS
ncbi:hypothetical protein Scep_016749 [Stephania cephalantha]|uniref:Uncharacterized protein n=1 Tax=Stephania cephalantha TaxID=152367 RepID=A0AAP0INA7_9MAGN